jgi:hypothetical protein
VRSISDYLKFRVTTNIQIKPQNPIDFPIVKICDVNMYSSEYGKMLIKEFFSSIGILSPFNITTTKKKYMRSQVNFLRDLVRKNNVNLSGAEKKKLSIEFRRVFMSGSLGNEEFSSENFTWGYDDDYSTSCYTFNSGVDSNGSKTPVIKSTQSGIKYSFRLELLLPPPDNYFLDLSNGVRIFVGDSSMEASEYEFVGLSSRSLINVGIKKTVSRALPYPYSDCNPDPGYSQTGCIYDCYELIFTQYCNCSVNDCFSFGQVQCEHEFHDKFFNEIFPTDACSMRCASSCERTVYELSTSSFAYPSDNYAKNLYDNRDVLFKNQNYSISLNHLKNNMIGLLLYWKNLEYTLIEETPSTTELDLIANVGGLLGKI